MIDTHSAVKQLVEGGMSESLAETVVRTQQQLVGGEVATRADLAGVKVDLAGVKVDLAGVKADLAEVKADLAEVKADLAGVKVDLNQVRQELTQEISEVRHEIELLRKDVDALDQRLTEKLNRQTSDMTVRLGGLIVLGIAILEALRRLA